MCVLITWQGLGATCKETTRCLLCYFVQYYFFPSYYVIWFNIFNFDFFYNKMLLYSENSLFFLGQSENSFVEVVETLWARPPKAPLNFSLNNKE